MSFLCATERFSGGAGQLEAVLHPLPEAEPDEDPGRLRLQGNSDAARVPVHPRRARPLPEGVPREAISRIGGAACHGSSREIPFEKGSVAEAELGFQRAAIFSAR